MPSCGNCVTTFSPASRPQRRRRNESQQVFSSGLCCDPSRLGSNSASAWCPTHQFGGAGHALGYEVVCHSNGVTALHDASQTEYAAVVLDLLMPQMDGYEFLDRFRQIDQCRNTLVIVRTGKDISAAEMERLKSAAQAVALKDRHGIDTVLTELRRHAREAANPDMPRALAAAQ